MESHRRMHECSSFHSWLFESRFEEQSFAELSVANTIQTEINRYHNIRSPVYLDGHEYASNVLQGNKSNLNIFCISSRIQIHYVHTPS